uniref:Uncharacterized protein n=1 Tax=Rhodnius prolixus TaxID=13249 RepID=T1HY68_RHOPR
MVGNVAGWIVSTVCTLTLYKLSKEEVNTVVLAVINDTLAYYTIRPNIYLMCFIDYKSIKHI